MLHLLEVNFLESFFEALAAGCLPFVVDHTFENLGVFNLFKILQ